ncbi:YqhG family protein [Halobacillus salinus]|uniref:YqhG family protein n=1 Tax=Halobacillus salinus TaxID=192814 RepID=A0A4Z0H4E3_9BACI|nr:YqhG family protein [Halobacillus salinus]TGB04321.1 hypothetical protein E4663_04820 [Halobacillus salinus]
MRTPQYTFVREFFTSNGCTISEEGPTHMTIQLTSEMDEEIMNRPFYWHYMKKMNRMGEPMELTFTESKDIEGIYLHPGTPKLHTIFQTAMTRGRTARLYEVTQDKGGLTPWLVINLFLHFRGKQSKNEHLSLGLNLLNGAFVQNTMEFLRQYDFDQHVSDYTFPITPIIQLPSAYRRMEGFVEQYAGSLDHQWAKDSRQHWEQEQSLLNSFYKSGDLSEDYYTNEKEQLSKRYHPRIEMEVVNGGLFYLSQSSNHKILQQDI